MGWNRNKSAVTLPHVAVAAAPKPQREKIYAPKPLPSVHATPGAPLAKDTWRPLLNIEPVLLVAARPTQCRWPVEVKGGQEEHYCCGLLKLEAGSYCRTHAKMAFYPQRVADEKELARLARMVR